ncbi:MAG: hypothetical protein GXO80_03430 [Chlorobi bacterium]|nr:hypothetical protein [Chlorobiota bacterium]
MKKIILIIYLLFIFNFSYSQSYFTAGGARLGTNWGLTFQQKILKHTTIEGIFQSSLVREELMLTGLVEHHFPLLTKRLNIYLGAGFHKGFVTDNTTDYQSPYGMSVIAGAEFTIARFVISYDYKPAFNFSGGENFWYSQTGISVRYVFIKQNVFKKIKRRKERERKRRERILKRRELFHKKS